MTEEQARAYAAQQLSSAQTLTTIAMIGAPVSLIIGGVPLAVVTLICGLVALSKIRSSVRALGAKDGIAARLMQQAVIGLVISVVSIIANAMYLVTIMPAIMEYARTGDISTLMDSLNTAGGASASSSSSASSVWD